jgi:hypothetical protein
MTTRDNTPQVADATHGKPGDDHDKDRDPKTVEIEVNNRPVSVPVDTNGGQIKQLAGVDATWQLFRIQGDHEIEVGDTEPIKVHKHERFVATPGLDPA